MGGSKKTDKGGKSAKSKGSKSSAQKVVEDETNTKTGEARFKFLNRDLYEGQFKITTVPENYICRQGPGTYKTADGQTYEGLWEKDVLKGEMQVTYKDGGKYTGQVEDMKYSSLGRYEFPDQSATISSFVADRPVGEMVLVDPAGHQWRGLAGPIGAFFIPINRFLPITVDVNPSEILGSMGSSTERNSRSSARVGRRGSKASKTSQERRMRGSRTSRLTSPGLSLPRSPPMSPTSSRSPRLSLRQTFSLK